MLRRCPAVVAVSAAVRDSLVQELTLGEREQRRLHVITNGVEVPERLAAEERAHVRSLHNIGEQELLVLAAGRLAEQKNFKTLIEAAGLLQAAGHAFRLVIGGEGPEREELAGRIDQLGLADRVQLPGNIPDLRRLMLAADIFVLSSLWEGLPLVLLEAMACGLPIVGTRISGIADVITDGIQGLLATPGDAVDLSRALGILLDDAGSRMELGREGRELVKREYDFQRVAEQLGQLYAQIL
jgi:glycosyltransferase involved in cell wall biosynthesis